MASTCASVNSRDGSRVALCASCNRCRARKTKCDGKRPCGNCARAYMKKHRLTSIEGIDVSLFDCVYSPAKRRGPVPGKASQNRKTDEVDSRSPAMKGKSNLMRIDMGMGSFGNAGVVGGAFNQQQAQLAALMGGGMDNGMGINQNTNMQDTLALQQQLMMQQQQQFMMQQGLGMDTSSIGLQGMGGLNGSMGQQSLLLQQQLLMQMQQSNASASGNTSAVQNSASTSDTQTPAAQRLRRDQAPPENIGVEKSVAKNIKLLEKSSVFGNRLRAYYNLSIDSLFNLPPVPSDEEYCAKLNANMVPSMLPPFDVSALRAARFSEIALGALVSNQIPLALELSNATVVCLKQCVEEPVHPNCMYDVAKAYFLHGMFRSYRGDMQRYFKYRRVCLANLSQLSAKVEGIQQLLAAISFHDSLAYIIYNAAEDDLPTIDDTIPQVNGNGKRILTSAAEQKYQVCTDHSKITSDPNNQMWIQGPPPVFINNEAPPLSRSLDALACAIRSCCDQSNTRFEAMAQEAAGESSTDSTGANLSVTRRAVMSNEKELCSRNMVLSAFTLLRQSELANKEVKHHGHHFIISSMDAFLDGGDGDATSGFTDSQIQSLLSCCNAVINHPPLLYQGGPTYHMASNAAILLCHLLNGLHAKRQATFGESFGEMESALFDEVLDTYIAVRKVLHVHRRNLPALIRCHGLPRPNLASSTHATDSPFVDLGQTHMCASRGCQAFVLMACSPCVAAERAQAAQISHQKEMEGSMTQNGAIDGLGGDGQLLNGLEDDLDLNDDDLLNVLGKIVAA